MHSDTDRQREWLTDILKNIDYATEFTAGVTMAAFLADTRTVYATIRCLEIISEASRRVSSSIKDRHPEIDWSRLAGSGNLYRHEYSRILPKLVWNLVINRLPELRDAAREELARLPPV